MKKLNLDFFKTAVLVILLGFLFVFYQTSLNGRYVKDGLAVFDTRTGDEFVFVKGKLINLSDYKIPN